MPHKLHLYLIIINNPTKPVSCTKDDDLDEDDDEGWITPKNFAQKRLEMFGVDAEKKQEQVKVACMTTDFAMQNVLRQMGLNVVSVDGVVIHETKTW